MTTKTAIIRIDTDTTIDGYGVVYAGEYTIQIPTDYDPALVTATDMVIDPAIRVVDTTDEAAE